MKCKYCDFELEEDSIFCENCGKKIVDDYLKCSSCGKENDKDSLFCEFCGTKIKVKKEKTIKVKEVKPKKEKVIKEKIKKEPKIKKEKQIKIKEPKVKKEKQIKIKEAKPKKEKVVKERKNIDISRLKKPAIITLCSLIIVFPVVYLFLNKIIVPDLIGLYEAEVIKVLNENKLKGKIIYSETSNTNEVVIKQSKEKESKVFLFEKVLITINKFDHSIIYSDWVEKLPKEVNDTDYLIETKEQYSYRTKDTTTFNKNKLEGFTLYKTSYLDEYGSWSDWSTEKQTKSNTKKVESKIEYSSRTKNTSKYYTDWSNYSTTKQSADGTNKEERTRKTYRYFYFPCRNNARSHDSYKCWTWACYWQNGVKICGDNQSPITTNMKETWSTKAYNYSGSSWQGTGTYIISLDGEVFFYRRAMDATRTEYSYRELKEKITYGDWSYWNSTAVVASDTLEVKTRTMYRYAEKEKEYHFYKWNEWSEFDDEVIESSDSKEVKTRTLYRYAKK